jgi:hypothetical protein
MPEWLAKSAWDQPSRARAAFTCRVVTNFAPGLIEILLTRLLACINRNSIYSI